MTVNDDEPPFPGWTKVEAFTRFELFAFDREAEGLADLIGDLEEFARGKGLRGNLPAERFVFFEVLSGGLLGGAHGSLVLAHGADSLDDLCNIARLSTDSGIPDGAQLGAYPDAVVASVLAGIEQAAGARTVDEALEQASAQETAAALARQRLR